MNELLSISDLHVAAEGTEILRGVDLRVSEGEIHALMGPNGSGKSTLANTLLGDPAFTVTSGSIKFKGEDVTDWAPDARAKAGMFLAFQHPEEIAGVPVIQFLRQAMSARQGIDLSVLEVRMEMLDWMKRLGIDAVFGARPLNEGFSGGESKRNEVLQLALLAPKWPSSTRPTRASTSTLSRSWRTGSGGAYRAPVSRRAARDPLHADSGPAPTRQGPCARRRPDRGPRWARAGRPTRQGGIRPVAEVTRPVARPERRFPASRAQDSRSRARLPRLGRILAAPEVGARRDGPLLRETATRNVHRGVYAIAEEADASTKRHARGGPFHRGSRTPRHEVSVLQECDRGHEHGGDLVGRRTTSSPATPSC